MVFKRFIKESVVIEHILVFNIVLFLYICLTELVLIHQVYVDLNLVIIPGFYLHHVEVGGVITTSGSL